MAPFRRGKSGPRSRPRESRTSSTAGGKSHRGGSRGISATKIPAKNTFQTSRLQDLVDDRSDNLDSILETSSPGSASDEPLSHDEASGIDEVPEKPFNVLLHTLNPKVSDNEPRNKRRRLTSDTSPAPTIQGSPSGDLDALEDVEDEGELSDEGSADGSDVTTSQQGESSRTKAMARTHS